MTIALDRRDVLAGAGGLVLAAAFAGGARADAPAALTAYLSIGPDGAITLWSPTTEMGQGTHTGHAALVADELGVDIGLITVKNPQPAAPFRRGGGAFGPQMSSGGSWGLRGWIVPLRIAGAQAREMLKAAAAARWGVSPADVAIQRDGRVTRIGGREVLSLGAAAADAARITPPADPPLTPPAARRHVGRDVPRLDLPAKVRGEGVYAHDVRLPGMLVAVAVLNPMFRGGAEGFDAPAALAVKGVRDVVDIPGGAAVIADDTWSALKGAQALTIRFADTGRGAETSASLAAERLAGLSASDVRAGRAAGEVDAAFAAAATVVEATYEVPYLAHAPMEPWTCTARFADGRLEVWAPTQAQDRVLTVAAQTSGLPPEAVTVHTRMPGGGFGHRLLSDGVAGAVIAARAAGRPVKLIWTRETEFAHGRYRPAMTARLRAGLDRRGRIVAFTMRTCGHSLASDIAAMPPPSQPDWAGLQNTAEIRYSLGAHRFDNVIRNAGPTTAAWRAVGATHNAYFVEAFMDELAKAAGQDPVAFRLAHLDPADPRQARARRLIEATATAAGWDSQPPSGRKRGFAYFESYGSLCAQALEMSLENGRPRVHRVWCGLDAGEVLMPDQARQQIEGGVIQGLSAALFEDAPIAAGKAVARNFDAYRILRIDEAPEVTSVIVNSGEAVGGVGEPPTPPTFAAAANAYAALTGAPVRSLPIVKT